MKARNSKARYLTKSELIGIGSSAVLSFLIVFSAMFLVQTVSWTVYNNITDLVEAIHLVFSEASMRTASSRNFPQSPISHILPLSNDVSLEYFHRNYFQKNPMVFSLSRPTPSTRENIFKTLEKKYAKQQVRAVNVYTMTDNGGQVRSSREKQSGRSWWSKRIKRDLPATNIAFQPIEIILKDFREADTIEQIYSATKGMKGKRTEQDTNHYYLNDCEVISTMPNVKDLLKANLPTLPFQSLDNSSSQQTAEHILDWDDENICLSVGRGNITAFSGSTFHIHKHSVSVLLSGKKHWVIFPPDRIPYMGFNPYENLEQWLLTVYPRLSQATSGGSPPQDNMPFEVLQQAGEAVYIPEGWYHAARTLGLESVSVRFQAKGEDPDNFYFYLVDGEQRLQEKDYNGAIMSFKLGINIYRHLYHMHTENLYSFDSYRHIHPTGHHITAAAGIYSGAAEQLGGSSSHL